MNLRSDVLHKSDILFEGEKYSISWFREKQIKKCLQRKNLNQKFFL